MSLLQSFAAQLIRQWRSFNLGGVFRLPPAPPLAFALADHAQSWRPAQMEEQDEEEWENENDQDEHIFMMAVPKRRVSHRRKRIKFAQKHLKPIQSFATCRNCGEMHPQYYQLCPFCQPFNNFIKSKDVPMREIDRVKRTVEQKILATIEEEQKSPTKPTAEAKTKIDETKKPNDNR